MLFARSSHLPPACVGCNRPHTLLFAGAMSANPTAGSPSCTPPRVRMVFRIGVVGHRPNRLQRADAPRLCEIAQHVFTHVAAEVRACHAQSPEPGYDRTQPPLLRVVSPLAEGTDRMLAEVGLDCGCTLCCPMPFAQAEYERDFAGRAALEPDSVARFHQLLDRGRAAGEPVVFELDGDRADEAAGYGAAGRVVINQSDLLLAVWDGEPARGGGGTVQTMREALQLGVPVLWIDAHAPHACQLVRDEAALPHPDEGHRCVPAGAGNTWGELVAVVRETLQWPVAPRTGRSPGGPFDLRETFFREQRPRWNFAFVWRLFRNAVGEGRLRAQPLRVADFEEQVASEWPAGPCRDEPGAPAEGAFACVNRRLRPHFAWADRLADIYGDKYRSAFVLAFPLAAVAVFLALLPGAVAPLAGHDAALTVGCVVAEFGVIACIFALVYGARRGRWHERWMDYRLLAETIRQVRFLVPLGGGRPFVRQPAHLATYGDPAQSWVFAHMRAIARATGLPSARVDAAFVRECLAYVGGVVRGQVRFHETSVRRCEHIEHRLHRAALALGLLTVAAIVIHLLPHIPMPGLHGWHLPAFAGGWLTFACAGFPALAAALAGIAHQGEFARVAKRSHAMAARFQQIAGEIERLEQATATHRDTLRLAHVTPLAAEAAQLMVDEILDWRVVFLDRPPVLPA